MVYVEKQRSALHLVVYVEKQRSALHLVVYVEKQRSALHWMVIYLGMRRSTASESVTD